jgi:glycosyltransferase involved in cell wall biosynthesis
VTAVHLLHTIAYGGIETILINWHKSLKGRSEASIKLSFVCFENPGHTEKAFLDAASAAGMSVRTIPWSRRKPVFSSGRKLASILRSENADILHTHNTYADLTGLVAARLAGVKTVSSLYVWSDFGWKRNILQWINKWALRSFDGVTAQCECTLRDTWAHGVQRGKVRVLPSGFEVNKVKFAPAERNERRQQLGAGPQDIVLINVARFYPEKAHGKLLSIFKGLVAENPNLKLWLLGVGPLDQELRAQSASLGLDGSVRFLGFRPDLEQLLKLADIQVHPSFAEGIPMATLSGMAAALPIVASSVGGIPEVLRHEVTGLLAPGAGHPDFDRSFTDSARRLILDSALRQRLGAGALRFIETEYSMETSLNNLEALYRDLLAA